MKLPRARRRFGQHFLHDTTVTARIIAAIAPRPGDSLVEIGPGPGALTAPLLATGCELDAIEIDRDLAASLQSRFGALPNFHLQQCDALTVDWQALATTRGRRLRVVGNLPYNISTPLLFSLLEAAPAIEDMHFMLQKEVVDRIVASPGSSDYGRLTAMLAPRVQATRVLDVAPGSFTPPPRVHSSVVRLQVDPAPPAWALLPGYGTVVMAAFGQRRKTLRNSLGKLMTAEQISACGIDPSLRAERLSPNQFGSLATAIGAMLGTA